MVGKVPADGPEAMGRLVLLAKPFTIQTVASELYACWATLHSK
jgi:hypothetical protein